MEGLQEAMNINPFRLRKVCDNCPFRNDAPFYLDPRRVVEIEQALERGETFHCHKTIEYTDEGDAEIKDKTQMCAGAIATITKGGTANATLQIGERLGIRDPEEFDHESMPTYNSLAEWREHMHRYATPTASLSREGELDE